MRELSLHYDRRARTSPLFYVLLIISLIFVFSGILINPATNCIESPCPLWLRLFISGLGTLFGAGALYAIVRDFRFGSRVEQEARSLVWWEGYPPVSENVIPIDAIKTIVVNSDSANRPVVLLDAGGKPIRLSGQCIPAPHAEWADQMKQAFDHIEVRAE